MERQLQTYEVLVLGGGSAGTAAAAAAKQSGAKVAMFNEDELGGLCILRGCMPTKTMLHSAHLVYEAGHHHTPGIGHSSLAIDFKAVMANKDAKVARFKKAKVKGIEAAGYEVIRARGRFVGPDTVEAGGQVYRFTKGAVIATGSVVSLPSIPGIESVPYWTSDDIMQLDSVPDSVLVLGSGAIGLELAVFLARMGSRVTLASRRRVLTDIDPLMTEEMEKVLRSNPNLELASPFKGVCFRSDAEGVHLDIEEAGGARTLSAKHFLAATGRKANLEDLGLEAAGVEVEKGRVVHDAAMRTSNERVFVAGDATGRRLILHVANWEGRAAGLGAAQVPGKHDVDHRLDMQAIFTDPPLAVVGMTEAGARAAGLPVATAQARFPETGRAITMDAQAGAWKLVAQQETGEILGSQILGPHADDLVHTVAAVMYYHGTAQDLLRMPWYHPTVSEVMLSLAREVTQSVSDTVARRNGV